MLNGNVLAVEEKEIDGKKFFKTLIMIPYNGSTILCEKYLQELKKVGGNYEVLLDRTDNLKYLNVRLGKEILTSVEDTSKKSIFNK